MILWADPRDSVVWNLRIPDQKCHHARGENWGVTVSLLGREKFIHCKKLMLLNILNSRLKSKCLGNGCCCFLVIGAQKRCGVCKEQVVFCVFCCNLVTMRDRRALWSLPGWDWCFDTGVSSLLTRNSATYDQTDKIPDCIKDWLVKKCACIKSLAWVEIKEDLEDYWN